MVKLPDKPKLPYTKWIRSKGKLYGYFNTGKKVNGKPVWVPLPPFSSPGFFEAYAAMKGARTKRLLVICSVAELIREYQRSDDFTRLSVGSQKTYSITLRRVEKELGKHPIDRVEKRHIREIIENRIEGNGSRNIFLSVVGVLYRYARSRDLTELNPVDGIRMFKMGQHEPWPPELLQAGLVAADDRVRLAVHLLYFTGQRIGDVCKMRWADVKDGRINVIQQKTGKPVNFRMVQALKDELDKTKPTGITILTQDNGQPVKVPMVRYWLQAFCKKQGFDVVPHGLRKNAVNSLLMAGCTIAETASVTGQSFALVEYYARRVDASRLGDAAMLKFDIEARNTA